MKITVNETLIKRNARIARYTTLGSMAVLIGGFILSLQNPEDPNMALISWAALILGFILMQIGIYFNNRWGRKPRPDELLTQSLKGMDDRTSLIHWSSPVPHLLTSPSGLWVLLPYHQAGKISYQKNRYRYSGGNLFLKFFGQEGMGRPEIEAESQMNHLKKELVKKIDEADLPPINAVLVFTNEKMVVDLEGAPVPGVELKKLKEFIRKRTKAVQGGSEKFKELAELFS